MGRGVAFYVWLLDEVIGQCCQWLGGASASAWSVGMVPLLLFIVVPLLIGLPLLSRAVAQPARWGAR